MNRRYQIEKDGITHRPRFSRAYAVVDTNRMCSDGRPRAVLETNDPERARAFAAELNYELCLNRLCLGNE